MFIKDNENEYNDTFVTTFPPSVALTISIKLQILGELKSKCFDLILTRVLHLSYIFKSNNWHKQWIKKMNLMLCPLYMGYPASWFKKGGFLWMHKVSLCHCQQGRLAFSPWLHCRWAAYFLNEHQQGGRVVKGIFGDVSVGTAVSFVLPGQSKGNDLVVLCFLFIWNCPFVYTGVGDRHGLGVIRFLLFWNTSVMDRSFWVATSGAP